MDDLRESVRDLADCVRDLSHAHSMSAGAREGMRADGQTRGEVVIATMRGYHKVATQATEHLTNRVDALNLQVQQSVTSRIGAPWWLVFILVVAMIIQSGTMLSLYASANGDDPGPAFRNGAHLVPSVTSPEPTEKP